MNMNQVLHDYYKDDGVLVHGDIILQEKWIALPYQSAYEVEKDWYETMKRMCKHFLVKDTRAIVYYDHFYAVYEEGGLYYQIDREVFL